MKNINDNSFTAGEFAMLCGTTKQTLRHYNKIGILHPERIGENGYGYYSPSQLFDFYLISSLKRAGSPLTDIRRYMKNPEAQNFLKILYKQQKNLLHEKMLLERMEELIHQSILNIEQALSIENEFGIIEYIECPEEYFIATEAPDIQDKTELEQFDRLQDHMQYCTQNDIGAEFQIGVIVLRDALLDGSFKPEYFCSRVFKPCQNERLFIKPEGSYVSILYKGVTDTRPAYRQLMAYINENHLSVCGNAYECELAGFLSTGDAKNYICRISIQVAQCGAEVFDNPPDGNIPH